MILFLWIVCFVGKGVALKKMRWKSTMQRRLREYLRRGDVFERCRNKVLFPKATQNADIYSKYVLPVIVDRQRLMAIFSKLFGLAHDNELPQMVAEYLAKRETGVAKEELKELYQKLLRVIKGMSYNDLHGGRWLTLETLFMSFGMFSVSYVCEEHWCRCMKDKADNLLFLWRKLSVAILEGNTNEIRRIIALIENKFILRHCFMEELCIAKAIYNTLSKSNYYAEFEYACDKVSRRYKQFINGREVLIIGPAPSKPEQKAIDIKFQKPIIVRFNDIEPIHNGQGYDKYNTDVSYIGGVVAEKLFEEKEKYEKSLRYLVLRKANAAGNRLENMRQAYSLNPFLCNGHSYMLQIVLVDILLAGAKAITVVKNNLYFTKNFYEDGYDGPHNDSQTKWYLFAIHNIAINYRIIKILYDAGVFKADGELSGILAMTCEEYLQGMEDIHNKL